MTPCTVLLELPSASLAIHFAAAQARAVAFDQRSFIASKSVGVGQDSARGEEQPTCDPQMGHPGQCHPHLACRAHRLEHLRYDATL